MSRQLMEMCVHLRLQIVAGNPTWQMEINWLHWGLNGKLTVISSVLSSTPCFFTAVYPAIQRVSTIQNIAHYIYTRGGLIYLLNMVVSMGKW